MDEASGTVIVGTGGRRRGRSRCLAEGSAAQPGSRSRIDGWFALRDVLGDLRSDSHFVRGRGGPRSSAQGLVDRGHVLPPPAERRPAPVVTTAPVVVGAVRRGRRAGLPRRVFHLHQGSATSSGAAALRAVSPHRRPRCGDHRAPGRRGVGRVRRGGQVLRRDRGGLPAAPRQRKGVLEKTIVRGGPAGRRVGRTAAQGERDRDHGGRVGRGRAAGRGAGRPVLGDAGGCAHRQPPSAGGVRLLRAARRR